MIRSATRVVPLTLCALGAVLSGTLAESARADEAELLRALTSSTAEAEGDFDTWMEELVTAVEGDPESPWSAMALNKILSLAPSATRPEIIEERLAPVLARGIRDGQNAELLRDVLHARATVRGDFDALPRIGSARGYLKRFAVIGPFGSTDSAQLHRRFAPESRDLDFTAKHMGSRRTVRWLPLQENARSAWVRPTSQIRQGGRGVLYAVAHVRSASSQPVAIKVICSASYKVQVNGRDVLVSDRESDLVPNPVWADARLEAGANRILVKVAGGSNFALKLADPRTGVALEGIEELEPLTAHALPEASGAAQPREFRTAFERGEALAKSGGSATASRNAVTAMLAADVGRDWVALEHWQRAAGAAATAEAVTRANILAGYGRFISSFDEYPPVYRKLRAKEQYEAALAALPDHHSCVLRLARYQNEDDHPDKAVQALEEYLVKRPESALIQMEIAGIAKQRGWEREALAAAEAALGLKPRSADAVRFLLAYDQQYGNWKGVRARLERLLEIDADDGNASGQLVGLLRDRGEDDAALALVAKLADRYPTYTGWRRQMAEVQRNLGQYDASLATYRALEAQVPEEDSYPRAIGEILEIRGDTDGAAQAYARSLALEPNQPTVRRALGRLSGTESDFAQAWEPDVDELIASIPSTEDLKAKYPKAVAVTVLDHMVTRANADGSSESIVHMVYKLLDEKGVQKYGSLSNTGELLTVRAIQPDGTVMKPTGLGGSAYNMEGLVPGTIVEHRFVTYAQPNRERFDGGLFYFQDSELGRDPNPVELSRWVVLAPKSLKLEHRTSNFDGTKVVEEHGDLVATIWEKRDSPRIDSERNMPGVDEIIPTVDYTHHRSLEDANWQFLSDRDSTWPTPMLHEALGRAIGGDMNDRQKVEALHRFVNTEITGDFGGGNSPSATLLEKAGDRGELFTALLRTAGIRFRVGRAMAWNGVGRDLTRATSRDFRGSFLWIEPAGSEPFPFFMGARYAPFGLVPRGYRGSAAFLASRDGGEIIRLPEGGVDVSNSTWFDVRLGADEKDVSLTGSVWLRFAQGYRLKKQLLEAPEDAIQKWAEGTITRYFSNPTLTGHELPRLDERGTPLEIRLEGTMSTYLSTQGGFFVVSLGLPTTDMSGRFVGRENRVYDLVLNTREDSYDAYAVHLGDHFAVQSLPEDHLAVHDLGTYSLTWRERDGRVEVRRERHFKPARYEADEYDAFVAWCKEIDDAEQRKLVLRKR